MSSIDKKDIQHLVVKAKSGTITPIDFCKELYSLGVKGQVARMRYVRDTFSLTSAKAREIVIVADHGSLTALAEEIKESDS